MDWCEEVVSRKLKVIRPPQQNFAQYKTNDEMRYNRTFF